MVYVTISKGIRANELSHYLTFSDLIMARSFLKNFDFSVINSYANPEYAIDSFWIHYGSQLTALVWNKSPKERSTFDV